MQEDDCCKTQTQDKTGSTRLKNKLKNKFKFNL